MLLWLWCRLATVAPTGPLAWEPPHAASVALKSKNNKNKKEQKLLFLLSFTQFLQHFHECQFLRRQQKLLRAFKIIYDLRKSLSGKVDVYKELAF